MATSSLLPVWPGWHRMPPPIEIRWSRDAWEALYGDPCERGWKPWPHEDDPREGGLPWSVFEDYMRQVEAGAHAWLPYEPPVLPLEAFRTIDEAHEAAEAVWMHGTPGL